MNEQDFDPNDVTESLKSNETDDQFDALAEGLAQLSPNWKVSIQRVQPAWCKGHLETIDIYDPSDHGIDMDYLIRKWGGRKLWIRILNEKGQYKSSGTINLFSFPPRVNGQELREHEVYGMTENDNPNRPNFQPMTIAPATTQHQQGGLGLDIGKLIDIIMKKGGAGADVGSILQIMEYARSQSQPQPQMQLQGMMEQMAGMMGMFTQMRQLFGDMQGGGGGGGTDDSLTPMIGEVAKALLTRQQPAAAAPPPRGSLAPPRQQFQAPPPPPKPQLQAQPAPTPIPVPDQGQNEPDDFDIVEKLGSDLSNLDPEDAAEAVMLAMDSMPEEKRGLAMRAFFSMGEQRQLDDQSTMQDTIRQGYETTDKTKI